MGRGMKDGGRSSGDVDVERVVVARRPTSATACLRYPHAPRDNTSPKRTSERPSRSSPRRPSVPTATLAELSAERQAREAEGETF